MQRKTAVEIVGGLIGTLVFVDLISNVFGPFGIFGYYRFWSMSVLGLIFILFGIGFLATRAKGEIQHARAAAGICFFFGVCFLFYGFFVAKILARFGEQGKSLLELSQFVLDFGVLFYALHELFLRVYPKNPITALFREVSIGLVLGSACISGGLLLFSL